MMMLLMIMMIIITMVVGVFIMTEGEGAHSAAWMDGWMAGGDDGVLRNGVTLIFNTPNQKQMNLIAPKLNQFLTDFGVVLQDFHRASQREI